MTWALFLVIISLCEGTGGDRMVIGDKHLKNKAYGVFQIRKPYVDDVNSCYRQDVIRKYGRLMTAKDMQNTAIAIWYVKLYLKHWGDKFESRHGRKPTWEELARIHNGGPRGYQRKSTIPYLRKYQIYEDQFLR